MQANPGTLQFTGVVCMPQPGQDVVLDRDVQHGAAGHDAHHLGQAALEVGQVVQHPHRERGVAGAIAQRQAVQVGPHQV